MTKPVNQPTVYVPQCGCDNVTYWNETIAGVFGVNVKSAGVCPVIGAATCKVGAGGPKCPVGRNCSLETNQCVLTGSGVCWGLPAACGAVPEEQVLYKACGGVGGSGSCLSQCEAVRLEKSYSKNLNNCP